MQKASGKLPYFAILEALKRLTMQQKSSKCIKGVGGAPTCPICKGYSIKYGFTKANKQRYQCKTCAKVYIKNYAYKAYLKYIVNAIVKLLQECCGIRSISRVLEIATSTVLSRIRKIVSSKSLLHYLFINLKKRRISNLLRNSEIIEILQI